MGGYFQSKVRGFIHRCLQFFRGKFIRPGIAVVSEHCPCRQNFDQIHSLAHQISNPLSYFPRAIGFTVAQVQRQFDVRGDPGHGAGAAGNRDVSSSHVHPGA